MFYFIPYHSVRETFPFKKSKDSFEPVSVIVGTILVYYTQRTLSYIYYYIAKLQDKHNAFT